jgi:hypothetical protein
MHMSAHIRSGVAKKAPHNAPLHDSAIKSAAAALPFVDGDRQ